MLTIPGPRRAVLGWLGECLEWLGYSPCPHPGLLSLLCLPWLPLLGWGGGAGGPEEYPGAALGVFSQWEVMAAACTLPTAAVKTASQPAAR